MNILKLSLFLLFVQCCSTKGRSVELSLVEKMSDDKCYYSVSIDSLNKYSKFEVSFKLEIIDPVYKDKVSTYTEHEILEYKVSEHKYQIPTIEPHTIYRFNNDTSFLNSYKNGGFMICRIEVPAKKEEFTLKQLKELSFMVKGKTVLKNGSVLKEIITKLPKNLNKNQLYFNSGFYTPMQLAVSGGYELQMDPIFRLQKRLKAIGYNLPEDGILNSKTIMAIKHFQKENNLSIGDLNNETLLALGI